MELTEYFAALARYHGWATRRLLRELLANLPDDEWRGDSRLFFGSIHRTVNHLLVTDNTWWSRFAESLSPRTALNAELHHDRAVLIDALDAAVQRWPDWLASIDRTRFDGVLSYTRNNGAEVRVPFAPALGHVFNHATHHRGQITAALTATRRSDSPDLDWIFLLQRESKPA